VQHSFKAFGKKSEEEHFDQCFFLRIYFYRKPFFNPLVVCLKANANSRHKCLQMKKGLQTIASVLLAGMLHAQTVNEKLIVVNGGKFESSAPYQDSVSVASYNVFTKHYNVFDVIPSQSVQALLVNGQTAYVAAEKQLVKYDLKSETKLASGIYNGASPHALALSGNKLLVGNWYGQADSFLYAYDATSFALQYVVPQITKDVKSILTVGDTAYLAQNVLGTIDNCGGFGCFDDSIGQIALVRISTGAYISTITLGESAAGVNDLYLKGNKIITVNTQANSITTYDIAAQSYTTVAVAGTLGRGVALVNDTLFLEINGLQSIYNLTTNSVVGTNLAGVSNAAKTVYDPIQKAYFQSTTDYSTKGMVFRSSAVIITDSVKVGIAPEQMGLYYTTNDAPLAVDNYLMVKYDNDTLVNVLANDTDFTLTPLKVSLIGTPKIFGATATVDSATQSVWYVPAIGIVSKDTLTYAVCDQAGLCDTAFVFIEVQSPTGVGAIDAFVPAVYPNPFTTLLVLDGIQNEATINVMDMGGRILMERNVQGNCQLDVALLPAGIYMLRIQQANGMSVSRVVKQ
jgi:hypothetical protein